MQEDFFEMLKKKNEGKKFDCCGIYLITNLINGKVYVGSSHRCRRRNIEHFSYLNRQQHQNPHLQKAWNKYGENNFVFEIMDICEREQLSEKEQYWAKIFDVYKREKGYNIRGVGEHPFVSKETKEKISKTKTGIKMSKEAKRNMSIAQLKKVARGYYDNLPKSIRQKLSLGRLGKKHTKETKDRISETSKRKNVNRRAVIMTDMDGKELKRFNSLADGARFLGITNKEYNYGSLNYAASGKRKTAYGYKWRFVST